MNKKAEQLTEIKRMYSELVPLRRICKEVKISQPLCRYYLDSAKVLRPEKDRTQEYLKQALVDNITPLAMSQFLDVSMATIERYLFLIDLDIDKLTLNTRAFKTKHLTGKNRMIYNTRLLTERFLPVQCQHQGCEVDINTDNLDLQLSDRIKQQIRHTTPSTFIRQLHTMYDLGEIRCLKHPKHPKHPTTLNSK